METSVGQKENRLFKSVENLPIVHMNLKRFHLYFSTKFNYLNSFLSFFAEK